MSPGKQGIVLLAAGKRMLLLVSFLLFVFHGAGCTPESIGPASDLDTILTAFHDTNSDVVLVAAHRAAHRHAPENSQSAIRRAIDLGVDIIEIDCRETADGVLVLLHDSDVDRTTSGTGKVADLTLKELQRLELGDESIPTLQEAFLLARDKIMIDLDWKAGRADLLGDLIAETRVQNQVLIFSGNFTKLDQILALDSTLMVMPRARSFDDLATIEARYHPEIVHIDPGFYTTETVAFLKRHGSRIWINALVKPDIKAMLGPDGWAYEPLLEHGANVLQTDRPRQMLQFLQKQGLHHSPERKR